MVKHILARGVIGNTTDFDSVVVGSSPAEPAKCYGFSDECTSCFWIPLIHIDECDRTKTNGIDFTQSFRVKISNHDWVCRGMQKKLYRTEYSRKG